VQCLRREPQAGQRLYLVGRHARDRPPIPEEGADHDEGKNDQRDDDAEVHPTIVADRRRLVANR